MKTKLKRLLSAASIAAMLLGATHAHAEFRDNIVRIAVRDGSVPFSYKDGGTYKGMAVDICMKVFAKLHEANPALTYEFVSVNSNTRIPFLLDHMADMECGSTTNSADRRKKVAFSIPYFVSSISGAVLTDSAIETLADVPDGSTMVFTKGTTTETAVASLQWSFDSKKKGGVLKTVVGKDHADSFSMLTSTQANHHADIFFNDDILLMGLISSSQDRRRYRLIGDVFSVEPYGIMTRKEDKDLQLTINLVMIDMMNSGDFAKLYDKWFMQPIAPSNKALNVPMSMMLHDIVRFPTPMTGN